MSVYRPPDCTSYRYDFRYRGRRYRGSTRQTKLHDAREVEDTFRQRLRRQSVGIIDRRDSPRFGEWAGVYFDHTSQRISRPEDVAQRLRVVLRFWGGRPPEGHAVEAIEGEPYHDLHLLDPIHEPEWIERFETWMRARGVGPQTRNHYRSVMSRMFHVAMLPKHRKRTGVTMNPFKGIERDQTPGRIVTVTAEQLRRWIECALPHVRLALAIGALAPKLRMQSILALRFDEHMDPELQFITVQRHKTRGRTGLPQVEPISKQLRKILMAAKAQNGGSPFVITYRGQPVTDIRGGVRKAAERAGLHYGRDTGGVTFHTLRHVAGTEMADLDIPETKRADVLGHQDTATTRKHTHLRPRHLVDPLEQLSRRLDIADAVIGPGTSVREKRETAKRPPER